jgi:hypothetical protein
MKISLEKSDAMGERMGRIRTDFFCFFLGHGSEIAPKKSVRIRPIRLIRSPIVSHCIPKPSCAKYSWLVKILIINILTNQLTNYCCHK